MGWEGNGRKSRNHKHELKAGYPAALATENKTKQNPNSDPDPCVVIIREKELHIVKGSPLQERERQRSGLLGRKYGIEVASALLHMACAGLRAHAYVSMGCTALGARVLHGSHGVHGVQGSH